MVRRLSFFDRMPQIDELTRWISEAVGAGARSVLVAPLGGDMLDPLRQIKAVHDQVQVYALPEDIASLGEAASGIAPWSGGPIDKVALREGDFARLSVLVARFTDLPSGHVVTVPTDRTPAVGPLFLISIPKSGTHFLFRMASAFGYERGIELVGRPDEKRYYCISGSNTHTAARDFFIEQVRPAPFGNRHHPFMRSPAIFIYRNPMDIVVSEAHYYPKDGNTPFSGYLGALPFEQRLRRLVDDPWLLGSIRDRVGDFIAWMGCPNVIPISFEEIVGARGGGSDEEQSRTLWSLQLKLQIAGSAQDFARSLFSEASPTFREGRIGSHTDHLQGEALAAFNALPQDFMEALGYASGGTTLPARVEEFRHRPLILSRFDPREVAVEVRFDFHGYNIIQIRDRFVAVTINTGELDLGSMSDTSLDNFIHGTTLAEVEHSILHAAAASA